MTLKATNFGRMKATYFGQNLGNTYGFLHFAKKRPEQGFPQDKLLF
jgi:hypothetical protein